MEYVYCPRVSIRTHQRRRTFAIPQDRDHFLFRIPPASRHVYRAWLTRDYKGWIDTALFGQLDAALRQDPESLLRDPGARVVRSRRNLTLRLWVAGRPLWLKRFRPAGPVDHFVYAVRPGKAVYAWNAAMALRERGFHTPRPLVGLRAAGRLGGAAGIVAFEEVAAGQALDHWLTRLPPASARRGRLLAALGAELKRFHDQGLRHRDLRQGNIFASRAGPDWVFHYLDLNRLRVQAPLDTTQRLRELERLKLPDADLAAFFATCMPDCDVAVMAAAYRDRVGFAARLEHLPLGRLAYKTWYYCWELRAFSRARRP